MDNELRHETIESIEDQLDVMTLILASGENLISEIETLEETFDPIKHEIKEITNSDTLGLTIANVIEISDQVEDEIAEMKGIIEAIRMTLDELRS